MLGREDISNPDMNLGTVGGDHPNPEGGGWSKRWEVNCHQFLDSAPCQEFVALVRTDSSD